MSKAHARLHTIYRKIEFIEEICREDGSITQSLADEKRSRASILMHLTSIAEQFHRLSEEAEFEILERFDKRDLKGSYDLRNYIAHDYEGVNLALVKQVIRTKLPQIKRVIQDILSERDSDT